MLLVGTSEIVGSAEVFLGTHIEVVVMHVIQHCIDARDGWNTDRSWRQTGILIGIVRTVDMQEIVVDSLEFKLLPSELDRKSVV